MNGTISTILYVNDQDNSIAYIRHAKSEEIPFLEDARMYVPGTKRICVQKGPEEVNPYEVEPLYALWDDRRGILIDEDDLANIRSEEDHANNVFFNELQKHRSDVKRAKMIREERDERLFFLDRMVCNPMRWEEYEEREREEMREYRKDLLDVTKHPEFPRYVEFPRMPDIVHDEFQKP